MTGRMAAEFIGTFWLVLGGCGSAVISAAFPEVGIGLLGVSLAFGLSVLTMAYAVGGVSGGHFNPAVTLGLVLAGRFESRMAPLYWAVQVSRARRWRRRCSTPSSRGRPASPGRAASPPTATARLRPGATR